MGFFPPYFGKSNKIDKTSEAQYTQILSGDIFLLINYSWALDVDVNYIDGQLWHFCASLRTFIIKTIGNNLNIHQ